MLELFVVSLLISSQQAVKPPSQLEAVRVPCRITNLDPSGEVKGYMAPLIVPAPGEQAGTTTYDYQQNGAMGNRVALDAQGNAHICWMHSESDQMTFPDRNVHYNFWDKASGSFGWPTGIKASGALRAGYTTGDVMPDGRAVVAFHEAEGDDNWAAVVVDAGQGLGAFTAPVRPDASIQVIWPHIVVGSNGYIHVVGRVNDTAAPGDIIYYSRSTDDGATFSAWMQLTANGGNDPAIAVSKDGQKVCVAFTSQIPVNTGGNDFACGHVNYIESTNGGTSWGPARNITVDRYADQIMNTDTLMFLFANNRDLDVAYDNAGKVQILYTEGWHQWNNGAFYYPRMWGRTMLWNEANGFGCPTANHPMFHALDEEGDTIWSFDSLGMWGVVSPVGEEHGGQYGPQLAVWGGNIIATWGGQYDSLDLSAGGTANGDLYGSVTTDNGKTWLPLRDVDDTKLGTVWEHVTNITNTHAPGAGVGSTPDEDYHTVWPWVDTDNILHITYIEDLFSGGVISGDPDNPHPAYGVITHNPVVYMGYNLVGIEEEPPSYQGPELVFSQPISSSRVTVAFSVPLAEPGVLLVRNVLGQTVRKLDVQQSAVSVIWDGSDTKGRPVPSGMYFVEVRTSNSSGQGKVTLIR